MTIEELIAKYPEFLTTVPCGVTCGDGWALILDRMFADFREIGGRIEVGQIKEKFGVLRVYIDTAQFNMEQVQARVAQAERESDSVCENCGNPGKKRDGGWIRTLCDECEECRTKSKS